MSENDELITVIQLFRHGDRNPVKLYNNILSENDFDPEELGRLTKEGKQLLYSLGKSTREKYKTLLGEKYSVNRYKILSSGADRTLASAQLFNAGIYPPTPSEIWNEALPWNPIPVFEEPTTVLSKFPHDSVVPKYKMEMMKAAKELYETRGKATGLVEYLSKNIDEEVLTGMTLCGIWDCCAVVDSMGIHLNEWVRKVYPEPLTDFYRRYLQLWWETPFRKRMYVGGFLHEIIKHFQTKISDSSAVPNLLTYIAHDSNIVGVLQTISDRDFKWPSYGANVTFELWRKNGKYVVNIYYSQSGDTFFEPISITLKNGKVDCELEDFKTALEEFAISREDQLDMRNQ